MEDGTEQHGMAWDGMMHGRQGDTYICTNRAGYQALIDTTNIRYTSNMLQYK